MKAIFGGLEIHVDSFFCEYLKDVTPLSSARFLVRTLLLRSLCSSVGCVVPLSPTPAFIPGFQQFDFDVPQFLFFFHLLLLMVCRALCICKITVFIRSEIFSSINSSKFCSVSLHF